MLKNMNREQLERIRRENLNKLDSAYRSNLNRIEYNPSESIEHFLTKSICFILLRNGVSTEWLQRIINETYFATDILRMNVKSNELPILITQSLRYYRQKFKHEWQRPQVVTEARFKDKCPKSGRRVDIFILDTGEIVEIETDPKVKKEGAITVRI
jgi:hypothetical protein